MRGWWTIYLAPERGCVAYPFAASDATELTRLTQSLPESIGSAQNQISSQTNVPLGCFAVTVDDLTDRFRCGPFRYIKIDVDGIEERILDGMQKSLARSSLDSILIEATSVETARKFDAVLERCGFVLSSVTAGYLRNRVYRRTPAVSQQK